MDKMYADIDTSCVGVTPFDIDIKKEYAYIPNEITPFNLEYLNQLYKNTMNDWYMYLYLCELSNINPVTFEDRRRYQKREAAKTFRTNHKEKCKMNSSENYKKNKEQILKKAKKYYIQNKTEILETHKIYRENNRDTILVKKRKDYNENKERYLVKKKQNIETNILLNLKYLFDIIGNRDQKCPFCGKTIFTNITPIPDKYIAVHHVNREMKTVNPNDFIKNFHSFEEMKKFNDSEGGLVVMHFGCHISYHNIYG